MSRRELEDAAKKICDKLKAEGKKVKVNIPPMKKPEMTDDYSLVLRQLEKCTVLEHQHGLSQLGINLDFERVYSKLFKDKNTLSAGAVCSKIMQEAMLELRIKAVAEVADKGLIDFSDEAKIVGVDLIAEIARLRKMLQEKEAKESEAKADEDAKKKKKAKVTDA